MYINFWYPIGQSHEITADAPHQATIMGLKYVAFRDQEGAAHVLSDTCVHRGGSIGKGWVKDGCAICPYHGWQFGGDGVCKTVPSIGYEGKPPARAKVDSYPVQEKYGLVFAFLGDLPEEERPSLYEIEDYDNPEWRVNPTIVLDVPFYFERSVENGLDPAHNEFVHPTHGFSGAKDDYYVRDYDVDQYAWGAGFKVVMESSGFKDEVGKKIRDYDAQSVAASWTHGPNTLITHIDLTPDKTLQQYFFEAPVDEKNTRIYFINLRNMFLDPELDGRFEEQNLNVAHQDIGILSELDPVRTPSNLTKEIMMPADKAVVGYREWLKRFEANGWRIDWKALKDKAGDVAYAVPSPARRTSGNWVLDPVPLIAPAEGQKAAAE